MSLLTKEQREALWDAYTTLRAVQCLDAHPNVGQMAAASASMLAHAFEEVDAIKRAIDADEIGL